MDGGEDLLNVLRRWVSAKALKVDNIEKYDLKVYGTDDDSKGEQYGSSIAFVDISAKNFSGERGEYNLVIKYRPKNIGVMETLPIRDIFEREIDIYTKIIPLYHKFQQERNLQLFASAPRCYLTKFTDTEQVIILENLKQTGYILHNRRIPMDIDHIKLVLEVYAEWHALSFALRDQKREDILEIKKNWHKDSMKDFLTNDSGKLMNIGKQYLYKVLNERGETDLLQRYKEKIGNNDARWIMLDLLSKEESQSVILHGDCSNNNFLFKYEDVEQQKPKCSKVVMLDFQLSYTRSPVFDLSYFIYAVASENELKHFKELLKHYYAHFASHLQAFGSDPEKLFSFSDLIIHFQKYGTYGAILNTVVALFAFVDKENTPDFGKEDGFDVLETVLPNEEYRNRVIAVAKHFVQYVF